MKTILRVGAVTCVALASRSAFADDDKMACANAAARGQILRNEHRLVEARGEFRVCARWDCPAVVQTDCVGWLDEVEKSIPTVVLSAKDASGNDAFEVSVTVDGAPLATKLDGVAVPMNPGPHTFGFRQANGAAAERQILVSEGQRAIAVAVTLSGPVPTSAGASAALTPSAPAEEPAGRGPVPWRTIGWITGAAGVVGLGVGTVFGAVALSKKNAAQCDSAGICTHYGSVDDARSAATIASVGFIAGGILTATGAALVLFAPEHPGSAGVARTAQVRAAPRLGPEGGGIVLEGQW